MNDYSMYLRDNEFVIYLFHGVIDRNSSQVRNYTHKHILSEHFSAIIQKLCSSGNPVSMPDIVAAKLGKYELPKKSFAITFDDGFENNYSIAAPILRSLKVPATIYITTGFIESNSLSWIDMIEFAVDHTKNVFCKIPDSDEIMELSTPEQKINLLNFIRLTVKNNHDIDPYVFASDFCKSLGIDKITPDPLLDNKMNWKQIRELHADPLFTIGGHSHTHKILSYLDQKDLEEEISISMNLLKKYLGCNITHYSYPEGLSNCYSNDVIDELKKVGIVCSPTAEPGINSINDDLFRLKRIAVT
jgi:peptidoglycan/xylan/chitin deacetylase (PgdA/CDA1 family)